MQLHFRPSASLEHKPLPSLPIPGSPTLTNPDMVLPDRDSISWSTPPRSSRPPSPSYLLKRPRQEQTSDHHEESRESVQRSNSKRSPPRRSSATAQQGLVLQASPARRAQYRYSDVALGSSPTVSYAYASGTRDRFLEDEQKRLSMSASSICSDDLKAMRSSAFVGFDSSRDDGEEDEDDTSTLGDTELDLATPSEKWHAGDQIEPPETEESAVTLMRAEMILANAKKRLNLMDQNLRGAREMVAPLTAANLRRATSLSSAFLQPAYYYGRAKYTGHEQLETRSRQQSDPAHGSDPFSHQRIFSESATSPILPERPFTSLSRVVIPVNHSGPSWKSNPLRGSRSQEQLTSGGRQTPRLLHEGLHGPPPLAPLPENDVQTTPQNRIPSRVSSRRSSTAGDLREQMVELKGRISNLKERAREDSLRRRSMQQLRQASPLADSTPVQPANPRPSLGSPINYSSAPQRRFSPDDIFGGSLPTVESVESTSSIDDTHSVSGNSPSSSISRGTITDISEETESESVYEDAADHPAAMPTRHEDREDAFDYGNFFLHSSMGTIGRQRGDSISSTDSSETARGLDAVIEVPPTPETPEVLRDIEKSYHIRKKSADSIVSAASFATAREGLKSGRQTPVTTAGWLAPKTRSGRSTAQSMERTDSGHNMPLAQKIVAAKPAATRIRSFSRPAYKQFTSRKETSTSTVATTTTKVKEHPLGMKDKALVFSLIESLKHICEQLQTEAEDGPESELLRQKLEAAAGILNGSITHA
ncbi:hypothetical protein AAFC00_005568 [Neodothiora populina]|uniref:Uncharacterized protein n=1 Tax=Neodothiora populina TaxID=2781224 RepID=A0ABR3PMC1_9PEZI